MNQVKISVTYFAHGKAVTHERQQKSNNPQGLFDNAVDDANIFAAIHGGQVQITRKIDSLYINYLDIKGCDLIDRMFLLEPEPVDNYGKTEFWYFTQYCRESLEWLETIQPDIKRLGSDQKKTGLERAIFALRSNKVNA